MQEERRGSKCEVRCVGFGEKKKEKTGEQTKEVKEDEKRRWLKDNIQEKRNVFGGERT